MPAKGIAGMARSYEALNSGWLGGVARHLLMPGFFVHGAGFGWSL